MLPNVKKWNLNQFKKQDPHKYDCQTLFKGSVNYKWKPISVFAVLFWTINGLDQAICYSSNGCEH